MSAKKPAFGSFKTFEARHAAPAPAPVPTPPAPVSPTPSSIVARPLRLAAHVDSKLHQLAAARGDISVNAVVSLLISEEWLRVFRPSTEILVEQVSSLVGAAMAATRNPSDTTQVPTSVDRVARTLRMTSAVDKKLGEIAAHYGGLDRTSTIALLVVNAWRRDCTATPLGTAV